MKYFIIAAIAALSLQISAKAALQEDDGSVIAAYKQYNEALEAGDPELIQRSAKLAYDRALEQWPADRLETGYIAANYGEVLLTVQDMDKALSAYRKCAEILSEHLPDTSLDLANCHYRVAGIEANKNNLRRARRSYEEVVALAEYAQPEDAYFNGLLGQSYLFLSAESLPDRVRMNSQDEDISNRFSRAYDYARLAIEYLTKAYGADSEVVADAMMLSAYYHEFGLDWPAAYESYRTAFDIYAAELGFDHETTRRAYGRARYSDIRGGGDIKQEPYGNEPDYDQYLDHSDEGFKSEFQPLGDDGVCDNLIETSNGLITLCAVDRQPPRYPHSAGMRGQFGYAEVRYDISPRGKPENIEVYTSWPEGSFEEAIIDAVEDWEYTEPLDEDGNPVTFPEARSWFLFQFEN